MRLLVFVLKKHVPHVTAVEHSEENTGIAHVVANKGGQVVKFALYGHNICFISSHLTAHEGAEFLVKRNESVAEILNGARVGIHVGSLPFQWFLNSCSQPL